MNDIQIKEISKLIEDVKIANNSSVCIVCSKEYENDFKEYFKGCTILTVPDRFETDKDKVWILPSKEEL